MNRMHSWASLLALGLPISWILGTARLQGRETVPEARSKAIVQRMCVGCHSINVVTSLRATPAQWSKTVQQMVARGAEGSDEEIEIATRYLAENFNPQSTNPPSLVQAAPAAQTPTQTVTVPQHPRNVTTASLAQREKYDATSDTSKNDPVRVNVNNANAKELVASLSLSNKEAETLIIFRRQNGSFSNWQDVAEVPGVPAGKIQELRTRIVF